MIAAAGHPSGWGDILAVAIVLLIFAALASGAVLVIQVFARRDRKHREKYHPGPGGGGSGRDGSSGKDGERP